MYSLADKLLETTNQTFSLGKTSKDEDEEENYVEQERQILRTFNELLDSVLKE